MIPAVDDPAECQGLAANTTGGLVISGFLIPPLAILVTAGVLGLILWWSPAAGWQGPPPNVGDQRLSDVFTPQVLHWSAAILNWADAASLDPNLVASVMQIESCGDPLAESRAGAMGLFQVMPYHFLVSEDGYSPDTNAKRGLEYLTRALAAAGGDVALALAGYNGGIGLISSPESDWPAETSRYVYWGTGLYADAASGAARSERLAEWLAAGGSSLCSQAGQRLQIAAQ